MVTYSIKAFNIWKRRYSHCVDAAIKTVVHYTLLCHNTRTHSAVVSEHPTQPKRWEGKK